MAMHNVRNARGFTLIELMVGIVIGLLAVLVTYQLFNVAEGFKRNTTAIGDAQQSGMLSSFLMSLELANANNGIASAGVDLDSCPYTGAAPDDQIKTTLRPIPVMITDSGDDMVPDSFVVNYGDTSRLVIPANFNSKVISGIDPNNDYQVQSPAGFLKNDNVVLVEHSDVYGMGKCGRAKVTDVSPTDTASITALNGYVTLQHDTFVGDPAACPPPAPGGTYCGDSVLLNMGPNPKRIKYDIANDSLRTTDLFAPLPVPQPLASNVVNLKAQYAIDTDNDGRADKWVRAIPGGDGDFSPAGVLQMSYADLSRIKAIRIALIVRSDQFDKSLGDWTPSPSVFAECGNFTCPAEPVISYAALTSPPGNYRYRAYETTIPLRNAIWNIKKK